MSFQGYFARQAPAHVADREAQAWLPAFADGHAGDLDFGGRAVLAAHHGGEQAHRAALAQIGDQHVEVDAGAAQPFFERLAAHLFGPRELARAAQRETHD